MLRYFDALVRVKVQSSIQHCCSISDSYADVMSRLLPLFLWELEWSIVFASQMPTHAKMRSGLFSFTVVFLLGPVFFGGNPALLFEGPLRNTPESVCFWIVPDLLDFQDFVDFPDLLIFRFC